MRRKIPQMVVILLVIIAVLATALWYAARFVYLSPSCYADNKNLSKEENYFIKKIVLEAIENRLSVFADENDIPQSDEKQGNGKYIFIRINKNFMNSVTKNDYGYTVVVNTYFMESVSDDCSYEIHISKDFHIISFELDP